MSKAHSHSSIGHGLDHRHIRATGSRKRLSIVLALTASYMVAEFFGGLWTGSLALLADAGHMLADVIALLLALMALWFGARPATPNKTFGYYRLEILAALINGVALILISLIIVYEAYQRLFAPTKVRSMPLATVAAGGLVVNPCAAWLLRQARDRQCSIRR